MADAWHDLSHEMVWAPRAVVAKAAPLLQEIWVLRVESRQRLRRAGAGSPEAPTAAGSRATDEPPPARPAPGGAPAWRSAANTRSDLPNNLRTLMMKCDMSDINFICSKVDVGKPYCVTKKPKMLAARCLRSVRSDRRSQPFWLDRHGWS